MGIMVSGVFVIALILFSSYGIIEKDIQEYKKKIDEIQKGA